MNDNTHYDERTNTLEVWCTKCGNIFEIPCTPEQYEHLDNRTETIDTIFPDLPRRIREVFILKICGFCYDESTGFFDRSTEEMNTRAYGFFKRLFPWVPEENLCRNVRGLYGVYRDILNYIKDYEDCDGFDPKAYNDLEEVTKALEEFTKEIEKL